jgi:MoaA/NifB/PqqE/SkfB family radical SAM enzyme
MHALNQDQLILDLALTSRCPLRCRYCSVQKSPYPELRAREWIRIVESFARLRPIELISLEGGKPFLRPDLPAILEACLDVAEKVKIVSSGVVPLVRDALVHNPVCRGDS